MLHTVAVDLVFQALADPTRRHILEQLAIYGTASASEIAADMPISRQAVVKHLNVLESSGLVSRERKGRAVMFETEPHQLAMTGRWLQRIAARYDQEND